VIGLDQAVTLHAFQFPTNIGSVAGTGDVKLEPPGGKPAANTFLVLSHVLDDPLSQGRGYFFRHDFVVAAIAADFEEGGRMVLLEGRSRDFRVSVDISCGQKAAAILEFCVESYFLFFIT